MQAAVISQHPYFPEDASIPDFVSNDKSLTDIVLPFAGTITCILAASAILSKRINPSLSLTDLGQVCWFVLSGYLHLFFEGYLILNYERVANSNELFAQLWKEYSLSDSRYLTANTFVISIETITVLFWGPCCIATAFCIATRHNLRYPLSIIVCMAHLYGVVLYYATSFADMEIKGVAHSRPEFLYFWVYFVGMNLPWAIVPSAILWASIKKICWALDLADRADSHLKSSDLQYSTNAAKKIQ
ncbi:hypothetical protein MCOR27_011380 [Pyricularia oryzae]|uniref:EXPERA domain-containing protein n=1 Tax=Pyricularia grisea TaxID=148305 RepID=A0ABQ8N452_PYRGI|nr:hypothetical protein MCOR01_010836 [Pyricularia oryzae]KAI6290953.1 hypothetical protein MCOR33_010939 [Pyricularia grisea]KAH9438141.1 hypothetical protein MCOR02_001781 [Pyricularia oryzae]KAI6253393.1 hypothetical protein MCOR19_010055 [Pyricularia oryzae]KAI6265498.1 hypothetical protein MCOR27_011380 [Pyricularia oryzae]